MLAVAVLVKSRKLIVMTSSTANTPIPVSLTCGFGFSGFGVWGLGFGVRVLGFGVWGFGFRVLESGFGVDDLWLMI